MHSFRIRFKDKADLNLAKLAYYLTSPGVFSFGALEPQERTPLLKELKTKLIEVSQKYSSAQGFGGAFLPATLQYFLSQYHLEDGDGPFYIFDNIKC